MARPRKNEETATPWVVRDVPEETRRAVKSYAGKNGLTLAEALTAIVNLAGISEEQLAEQREAAISIAKNANAIPLQPGELALVQDGLTAKEILEQNELLHRMREMVQQAVDEAVQRMHPAQVKGGNSDKVAQRREYSWRDSEGGELSLDAEGIEIMRVPFSSATLHVQRTTADYIQMFVLDVEMARENAKERNISLQQAITDLILADIHTHSAQRKVEQ